MSLTWVKPFLKFYFNVSGTTEELVGDSSTETFLKKYKRKDLPFSCIKMNRVSLASNWRNFGVIDQGQRETQPALV